MRATHLLAMLFAAAAAALAVTEPAKDPDLFWHLASGDWMLDHGRLLDRDVFSFTRQGTPYAVGQWLGQVTLALAFRSGGWVGIEVLRAALVGVSVLFLSRAVLRIQPHPAWAAVPIVSAMLVSRLAWGDRPQLFTLALFPLFLDLLLRARLGGGTRALWALPPLMLLWANLHGAFPLGLALILAFAVEAAFARRAPRRHLAVLGASVVAAQVNPAFGGALAWAASYATSPGRQVVEERPTDILTAPGAIFAALVLTALWCALRLGRDGLATRVGPPLLWVGIVVPFTLLGLAITRQLPYACDVLATFVAGALPAALARRPVTAPLVPRAAGVAIGALLVATCIGVAALGAPREPDVSGYPRGALGALRTTPGNLLNEYDWGGYLIRELPEHPVFIDGRGAALFVPDVLGDYQRVIDVRPAYVEVLVRREIALALLRPHRALVSALADAGWTEVAREPGMWILLRRP